MRYSRNFMTIPSLGISRNERLGKELTKEWHVRVEETARKFSEFWAYVVRATQVRYDRSWFCQQAREVTERAGNSGDELLRYKIKEDKFPAEVHVLDLINGNVKIHSPLNEEQFPSIKIDDGDEANSGGSLFLFATGFPVLSIPCLFFQCFVILDVPLIMNGM